MSQFTSEPVEGRGTIVDGSLSIAVVEAVADAADEDPVDLPPLYTAVDPDALDELFAPPRPGPGTPSGTIRFTYNGYDVTASADGSVSVVEQ